MRLRLFTLAAILALAAGAPLAARADDSSNSDGPFMVRIRALSISPANSSDAIPAAGVPQNAITVNSKVFPEVDGSYFFTPNVAAELILTYPQQQNVSLLGGKIGTFDHLPPTLTLQFHSSPGANIQPYAGIGLNYTLITSQNINVAGVGPLTLSSPSWGPAFQVGADVKVGHARYVNLDAKVVGISTLVRGPSGAGLTVVRVNPWLFGLGYGIRFK